MYSLPLKYCGRSVGHLRCMLRPLPCLYIAICTPMRRFNNAAVKADQPEQIDRVARNSHTGPYLIIKLYIVLRNGFLKMRQAVFLPGQRTQLCVMRSNETQDVFPSQRFEYLRRRRNALNGICAAQHFINGAQHRPAGIRCVQNALQ